LYCCLGGKKLFAILEESMHVHFKCMYFSSHRRMILDGHYLQLRNSRFFYVTCLHLMGPCPEFVYNYV